MKLPYHKGPKYESHETPQWLFDWLDHEFDFTLDVCANEFNSKCDRWFGSGGILEDGLKAEWITEGACWMNPPYGSKITKWVKKAYEESLKGSTVVGLLPSRTDPYWFHTWIYGKAEIRFIAGRLNFSNKGPAPFPSMIVIWRGVGP